MFHARGRCALQNVGARELTSTCATLTGRIAWVTYPLGPAAEVHLQTQAQPGDTGGVQDEAIRRNGTNPSHVHYKSEASPV